MTNYKLRKYLTVIPIITSLFVFFCVYSYWRVYHFLETNHSLKLSKKSLFLNMVGDGGDYTNYTRITVFFLIIFILFLFYLFPSDNPSILVRLKSRKAYVSRRIIDCAMFAFIFSFLIEAVSVAAALICCDMEIILYFKFLQYSALELLTLFLFYFRAGLVFLVFQIIMSKKAASFFTIALYIVEFLTSASFMISKVWLPFRDALVVSKLMTGEIFVTEIFGIILRALVMALLLILSAYFLYEKKDVLGNAKK